MANDEIKFLPIFQILDIKNIWFLLELEMALATAIKKKFEPVCIIGGPPLEKSTQLVTYGKEL